MPDPPADPKPSDEKPLANEPAERSFSKSKAAMVGFVSLVVLAETALFFLLVPSAEEVAALAEARLIRSVQEGQQAEADRIDEENAHDEYDLGMFGETFSPIDSARRYRLEFRLFAIVRRKDIPRLKDEYAAKEGRLRHAIRMKVRNSAMEELEDNQLGLLQRRILATCNELLSDNFLLSVGFHDYQLTEE
jgi:hypothetical protein